jgi:V8-like Glu-specific endopeptidase
LPYISLFAKHCKHSAEHGEEGAHHSSGNVSDARHFAKTDSVDEIENGDDSDSDNAEFITIKVTNEEGKTEAEEVDRIKEHKAR